MNEVQALQVLVYNSWLLAPTVPLMKPIIQQNECELLKSLVRISGALLNQDNLGSMNEVACLRVLVNSAWVNDPFPTTMPILDMNEVDALRALVQFAYTNSPRSLSKSIGSMNEVDALRMLVLLGYVSYLTVVPPGSQVLLHDGVTVVLLDDGVTEVLLP